MKKLILIALLAGWGHSFAQKNAGKLEYKQHISKQFTLQKPAESSVFALYNISGYVKVEGYSGNQVIIEVDETITTNKSEDLELAKNEFKVGFDQKGDSIIVYNAAPYNSRPHNNNNKANVSRNYTFRLDYTVKVPNNMNIRVSTINSGEVTVKDVYGTLNTGNVNGSINIINAKGATEAHTVNGNLTASYLAVPPASDYKTVNGKVEITYPASLSADLQLKSMNGQYYTDFPNTENLSADVVKTTTRNNNGAMYKLNKSTKIRIGNGGKLFKFETLNGNVYIKKS